MKPNPIPVGDELVTKTRAVTDAWVKWLTWLVGLVMRAPSVQSPVIGLEAQGASIATSSLPLVQFQGLYRLSYYLRVTRAATTSSSISFTFNWLDGGVAQTVTSAALTGNATNTNGTGTYFVWIDGGTTPTYSANYASVGGTSMLFRLSATLEQVNA